MTQASLAELYRFLMAASFTVIGIAVIVFYISYAKDKVKASKHARILRSIFAKLDYRKHQFNRDGLRNLRAVGLYEYAERLNEKEIDLLRNISLTEFVRAGKIIKHK